MTCPACGRELAPITGELGPGELHLTGPTFSTIEFAPIPVEFELPDGRVIRGKMHGVIVEAATAEVRDA